MTPRTPYQIDAVTDVTEEEERELLRQSYAQLDHGYNFEKLFGDTMPAKKSKKRTVQGKKGDNESSGAVSAGEMSTSPPSQVDRRSSQLHSSPPGHHVSSPLAQPPLNADDMASNPFMSGAAASPQEAKEHSARVARQKAEEAANLAKRAVAIAEKAEKSAGFDTSVHDSSPNATKPSDIPVLKTEDVPNTADSTQTVGHTGDVDIPIILSDSDDASIAASAADSAQTAAMPEGNIDGKNTCYQCLRHIANRFGQTDEKGQPLFQPCRFTAVKRRVGNHTSGYSARCDHCSRNPGGHCHDAGFTEAAVRRLNRLGLLMSGHAKAVGRGDTTKVAEFVKGVKKCATDILKECLRPVDENLIAHQGTNTPRLRDDWPKEEQFFFLARRDRRKNENKSSIIEELPSKRRLSDVSLVSTPAKKAKHASSQVTKSAVVAPPSSSDVRSARPPLREVNATYELGVFATKVDQKRVKMFVTLSHDEKDNEFVRFMGKYADLRQKLKDAEATSAEWKAIALEKTAELDNERRKMPEPRRLPSSDEEFEDIDDST